MLSSIFYYAVYVFSVMTLLVSAAPCAPAEHATTTPATKSASASTTTSGTHTGQGTWYETGLGACGITNTDSDLIVAVGHELFDTYPGYNGANPNNNPICGKKITANYNGKSVTVTAVDRCVGCAEFDLDFSPSAFTQLASLGTGRISNVDWSFN